jgi:hypothetical protein
MYIYQKAISQGVVAFIFGLTINKTTCYAGEFPDSFSFK